MGSDTSSKEYASSTLMLVEARLFCLIVLLNHATFEVACLEKRSALRFCSQMMFFTSKDRKHEDNFQPFIDIMSLTNN